MELLKRLIEVIEFIRVQRQSRYRVEPHPALKTFSQQELNDLAFASYRNYLSGRIRKLPSRDVLLSIGSYLECSVAELNDILLSAQYLPVPDDPSGITLAQRLDEGRNLLENLAYPGVLSTRDWKLHGLNRAYQLLWNVPAWEQIPARRQHNLDLLFHPDFAGRRPRATRMQTLQGALTAFLVHNRLYAHDRWFQEFIDVGVQFSDFTTLWTNARSTSISFDNQGEVYAGQTDFIYRFRFLHMSVGPSLYPVITMFIPDDEEARQVLTSVISQDEDPLRV